MRTVRPPLERTREVVEIRINQRIARTRSDTVDSKIPVVEDVVELPPERKGVPLGELNGPLERHVPEDLLKARHSPSEALKQVTFFGDEAHNEKSIARKIEEVAGMNVDSLFLQQRKGQFFIRARCGHAQHRVPATFHFEPAANFLSSE